MYKHLLVMFSALVIQAATSSGAIASGLVSFPPDVDLLECSDSHYILQVIREKDQSVDMFIQYTASVSSRPGYFGTCSIDEKTFALSCVQDLTRGGPFEIAFSKIEQFGHSYVIFNASQEDGSLITQRCGYTCKRFSPEGLEDWSDCRYVDTGEKFP